MLSRAVLNSFRARNVRKEGVAVFGFWREWAHWRALERRAIVAYWQKLMLLVSGGLSCGCFRRGIRAALMVCRAAVQELGLS